MLVFTGIQLNVYAIKNSVDNDLSTFDLGYEHHDSIEIDGNEEFTEKNGVRSGTGTKTNPYMINLWNVERIEIKNTNSNFKISSCEVSNIIFENVENGKIIDCNFDDDIWDWVYGISFKNSNLCSIKNCDIEAPIGYQSYYGINLEKSSNNFIENCNIYGEPAYNHRTGGIRLDTNCNLNVIGYCNIDLKGYGLRFEGAGEHICSSNYIYENNFYNCSIRILTDTSFFYKNNFIMLEKLHIFGTSLNVNYWYKDGIGNFYSDYIGEDKNNDGIGDESYNVNPGGGAIHIDKYPLMQAYEINSDSPSVPLKPNGPTSGKKGREYKYSTESIDSDSEIRYCFDWGDGSQNWTGFYESGERVSFNHIWQGDGNSYSVRVKARDGYGYESDWSDPLKITMPKSKIFFSNLWTRILERFPNLSNFFFL